MKRPRALDLCCRAGGASVGLYRAGFDVVGLDKIVSANYPFPVIRADVREVEKVVQLRTFDFIWASPPCQSHSKGLGAQVATEECVIEPVRRILASSGRVSCIENVECAPIRHDLVLTGDMFGLGTYRKRVFELAGFWALQPVSAGSRFGPKTRPGSVTVAGGNFRLDEGSRAMGINWMTRREIQQAVPPVYAEWIGRALITFFGHDADRLARPKFEPSRRVSRRDGSGRGAG